MDTGEKERLICEVTLRQLERMRAMQYAYHQKFFFWITLVFVLLVVMGVFGGERGWVWMPFIVVTAGVQAAFYLYFCDFARLHAAALEGKINGMLGKRVLMGAELESDYFYPLPAPKVAGFIPMAPAGFFSGYTLHWCGLWGFCFVGSLWAGLAQDASPGRVFLAVLAIFWAVAHALYVAWVFLSGKASVHMAAQLETRLHQPMD